jgi:PIN domain nuclease of toxin-antitoxin system
MTIVLDAWAILAMLKFEPAGPRVAGAVAGGACVMSSINLGEAHCGLARTVGPANADRGAEGVRTLVRVEDPDWPLVRAAARIKAGGSVSYADAFCVATAQRHGAELWTGDPEIIAFGGVVKIVDLR